MPRAVALLLLLHCATRALAVNATHIVIGQTIALSGYLGSFGDRSGAGLRLAFQEANDEGGAISRNLTLVTLDDQGQGDLALQNVNTLNSTHDAFLIAATFGNAPFLEVLPRLVQGRIPLVGPFTGLTNTRSPFRDVVINLRPSFADEMVAHARFLVEYLRVQRVACFFTGDDMGQDSFTTLLSALDSVGVYPVAVASTPPNASTAEMAAALEALLGGFLRPQAVVAISLETELGRLIPLYRQDPRADPSCAFLLLSISITSALGGILGGRYFRDVYFTRTVPPSAGDFDISRRFRALAAKYNMPPGYAGGQVAFEGYIVGRFIVAVLRGLSRSRLTREAFLDAVYNTRIFYLDDVPVGLFGRNFTGCEFTICSCNSGLRRMFMAYFDSTNSAVLTNATWPVTTYPITQCAAPNTLIRRPILFGQLVPAGDPTASRIARDITAGLRATFADINAAGGLNGRQFDLVTAEYNGDPANATAALVDRWPLVALLGSVVGDGVTLPAIIPQIGTFDLTPWPWEPEFAVDDVRAQATTPLELLALASFLAEELATTAHLRVRRSPRSAALLATLTKSINTFQSSPASAMEFDSPTSAFDGLSTGHVVGIGNVSDLLVWASLLQDRPALTLLTVAPCALRLLASGAVDANASVLRRVLFPAAVQAGAGSHYRTLPYGWRYGHLVGTAAAQVLGQSRTTLAATFTTAADMINAWYDVQVMKQENVVLGPYHTAANCTTGDEQCECNLGARSVSIISAHPMSDVRYSYQSTNCNVVYIPLHLPDPAASASFVLAVVLGTVLGAALLLALGAWRALRSKRNNRAAPKDPSQPFCIIFTDIQASTNLWATVPSDMAAALDTHHRLIRKLIRTYKCYEVKTIGDSFMCATKSPAQALRFALALQETFHQHHWGTAAIDKAYDALTEAEVTMTDCWNGLRVRVGIHFGRGNIKRDPVSQGYDYYGTVVNTAARIESVCHGGQIGVSAAVYEAVDGRLEGSVWTDLGPQVLRGLNEPLRLYQVLPEGPLSQRRFPALRIGWVDGKEEVLGEVDARSSLQPSQLPMPLSGRHARQSVVPASNDSSGSTSNSNFSAIGKWAEVHPLVQRGDATVEELRRHYAILQTGLSTLLASQAKAAKQQILRQLCDRMHVTDHGVDGLQLQRTLHGLIARILPATIIQQAQRRVSRVPSPVPSPTLRGTIAPAPTSIDGVHAVSPQGGFAVVPLNRLRPRSCSPDGVDCVDLMAACNREDGFVPPAQ